VLSVYAFWQVKSISHHRLQLWITFALDPNPTSHLEPLSAIEPEKASWLQAVGLLEGTAMPPAAAPQACSRGDRKHVRQLVSGSLCESLEIDPAP